MEVLFHSRQKRDYETHICAEGPKTETMKRKRTPCNTINHFLGQKAGQTLKPMQRKPPPFARKELPILFFSVLPNFLRNSNPPPPLREGESRNERETKDKGYKNLLNIKIRACPFYSTHA
jgi:hypothetical protein